MMVETLNLSKKQAAEKVLILCPKSAVDDWNEHLTKYSLGWGGREVINKGEFSVDLDAVRDTAVYTNGGWHKNFIETDKDGITGLVMRNIPESEAVKSKRVVVNYEQLNSNNEFFTEYNPKKVILDEGHRIINEDSVTRGNMEKALKNVTTCQILTGTPMPKKASDIMALAAAFQKKINNRYANPYLNTLEEMTNSFDRIELVSDKIINDQEDKIKTLLDISGFPKNIPINNIPLQKNEDKEYFRSVMVKENNKLVDYKETNGHRKNLGIKISESIHKEIMVRRTKEQMFGEKRTPRQDYILYSDGSTPGYKEISSFHQATNCMMLEKLYTMDRKEDYSPSRAAFDMVYNSDNISSHLSNRAHCEQNNVKHKSDFIASFHNIQQQFSESKIPWVVDIVDKHLASPENGKAIVFCDYKESMYKTVDELEKKFGKGSVVFHNGDLNDENKRDARENFKYNDRVKVFVATPSSCKESMSLPEANMVVFAGSNYDNVLREQAASRIDRATQTRPIKIVTLHSRVDISFNLL